MQYELCTSCRNDVPAFGPFIPSSPSFGLPSDFFEFLMCKLINCYRSVDWYFNAESKEYDRGEDILDICALGYASVAGRDVIRHNVVEVSENFL